MTVKFGKFKGEEILLFIKILHLTVFHAGSGGNQNPVEFFYQVRPVQTRCQGSQRTFFHIFTPGNVTHFPDHGIEVTGIGEGFAHFLFQFFCGVIIIFRRVDVPDCIGVAPESFPQPGGRGTEELHAGQSCGDFGGIGGGVNEFFQFFRFGGAVQFQIGIDFLIHMVFGGDVDRDGSAVAVDGIFYGFIHFGDHDPVKSSFGGSCHKNPRLDGTQTDSQKNLHLLTFLPLLEYNWKIVESI